MVQEEEQVSLLLLHQYEAEKKLDKFEMITIKVMVMFMLNDKKWIMNKLIMKVYLVVEIGIFFRNILADKNQSSSEYIGSKKFEL